MSYAKKRPKEEHIRLAVIIGCGNIGSSIASGIAHSSHRIDCIVVDHAPNKADNYVRSLEGVQNLVAAAPDITSSKEPRVVILAVKPDQIMGVLDDIAGKLSEKDILVSVAAGVSYQKIKNKLIDIDEMLGKAITVVRAMPNIPIVVRAGVTALYHPDEVPEPVRKIFGSVGDVFMLEKEKDFHAFTALASSSPAFIFTALEAMADAAVELGMSRAFACHIAAQTVFGSSLLVKSSSLHTAELKDQVASPGGTTISGLNALEEHRFRYALMEGVKQSAFRSTCIEEDEEE